MTRIRKVREFIRTTTDVDAFFQRLTPRHSIFQGWYVLSGSAGLAVSLGLEQLCQPLLFAAIELGGLDPPAMPVIAVPKEQPVGFGQIALLCARCNPRAHLWSVPTDAAREPLGVLTR